MNKYIIALTLFFLSSCFIRKKSYTYEDSIYPYDEVVYDEVVYDEVVYGVVDTIFVEDYNEEPIWLGASDTDRYRVDIHEYRRVWNIEEHVNYSDVVDLGFGLIAYNIPSDLRVNRWSSVRLRVSSGVEIESLLIGNRGIPIIDSLSNDKIIIESIEIDSSMSAKLYADGDFFIIDLTTSEIQKISERGYTEWIWRVKPLKSGNHYLKMIIKHSGKDTVVYEKTIDVRSDWKFSFTEWFSKWWQAVMSAVVIPILIPLFLWWRKKKN